MRIKYFSTKNEKKKKKLNATNNLGGKFPVECPIYFMDGHMLFET